MPRSNTQNEQMRAESRKKILAIARRLFAQQGFDGCNVSDIAREAGMSQGNIYWYFPSKEAVLKAVLEESLESFRALLAESAAQPGTAFERLDFFLTRYIAAGNEQGGAEAIIIIASLAVQSGPARLPGAGFDAPTAESEFEQALAALFAQAQAEGALRPVAEPRILAKFFFSFLHGLVFTYRNEAMTLPADVIHDAVLRLLGHNPGQDPK